jgi:hypothetical protein
MYPSWRQIDVPMSDFKGAKRKRCVTHFTLRWLSKKCKVAKNAVGIGKGLGNVGARKAPPSGLGVERRGRSKRVKWQITTPLPPLAVAIGPTCRWPPSCAASPREPRRMPSRVRRWNAQSVARPASPRFAAGGAVALRCRPARSALQPRAGQPLPADEGLGTDNRDSIENSWKPSI